MNDDMVADVQWSATFGAVTDYAVYCNAVAIRSVGAAKYY